MAQLTPEFWQTILALEGGYQDNVNDTGNYACGKLIGTNMGISAPALQQWIGRCPTVAEMKALSYENGWKFYAWYFDKYNAFKVENQMLGELIMHNTMSNPSAATKIEQRVLRDLGYNVSVDGVRGNQTITALNDAWKKSPAKLYNGIRAGMIEFYKSLNNIWFTNSWLRRMDYFPEITNEDATGDTTPSGSSNTSKAGFSPVVGAFLILMLMSLWKR